LAAVAIFCALGSLAYSLTGILHIPPDFVVRP
jgi:hypothetical protein